MIFEELYQEIILDHYKMPRNYHVIENADCYQNGNNPLCGDNFTLFLKLKNDHIETISFQGSGCAISTASASMMTDLLKNKTLKATKTLARHFQEMLIKDTAPETELLEELMALHGVKKFPMRIKCAMLPWHTLNKAIEECEKKNVN